MVKIFRTADNWLDVALRWGAAFSVAWATLTWLAKKLTWLGNLNWAEAVYVGLGAAVVLSFALSFALLAVRYFVPATPDADTLVNAPPPLAAFDDTKIQADISTLKGTANILLEEVRGLSSGTEGITERTQEIEEIVSSLVAKDRAEYVREQIEKIDSDTAKLDAALQGMIRVGSNPKSFDKTIDYKPPMRYPKEHLESVIREIQFMDGTVLPDIPTKPYNPARATPGDDAIVDDEFLYDYRTEHHNVAHLKEQLRVLKETKISEMRDCLSRHREMMENYGRR